MPKNINSVTVIIITLEGIDKRKIENSNKKSEKYNFSTLQENGMDIVMTS